MRPCGNNCLGHLKHGAYTNGDPFAIINSGNLMGTSVAALHFYRLYVRLTLLSHFGAYTKSRSDQGLVTYALHAILPLVDFRARALVFYGARTGFLNPPPFHRVTRRRTLPAATKTVVLRHSLQSSSDIDKQQQQGEEADEGRLLMRVEDIADWDAKVATGLYYPQRPAVLEMPHPMSPPPTTTPDPDPTRVKAPWEKRKLYQKAEAHAYYDEEYEHSIVDCSGQSATAIHQADRRRLADLRLRRNAANFAPWRVVSDSGKFYEFFGVTDTTYENPEDWVTRTRRRVKIE